MGPSAGRTVERLRGKHPDASPAELRAMVVRRGRRAVSAEGAFVGGPFIVLVPVAFCGALLLQVRTVLELAGLEGRDTTDPERAAELLVLQGVYADTAAARAALAAHPPPSPPAPSPPAPTEPAPSAPTPTKPALSRPAPEDGTRRRPGRIAAMRDLTLRMARLLGIVTPPEDGPGLLVRIGQWALVGLVFLVGLVAPLVWLPYMALSYDRATTRLMDRTTVHYVGSRNELAARGSRIRPGMLLAGLRALVSILVPAAGVAVVVVADLRIVGDKWPVIGILLLVAPVVVGGLWLWRRHASTRSP
ncbi:hypothetical protein [Streptomyces vilmorinianum]|uniref:hypothetical protein n=1 Tax=Streptomyces vilmorinianum TaxID=3051092 RepID=UPI0010FBB41B|nr:hypothetical protein [Streptomyces vilmorinianum]